MKKWLLWTLIVVVGLFVTCTGLAVIGALVRSDGNRSAVPEPTPTEIRIDDILKDLGLLTPTPLLAPTPLLPTVPLGTIDGYCTAAELAFFQMGEAQLDFGNHMLAGLSLDPEVDDPKLLEEWVEEAYELVERVQIAPSGIRAMNVPQGAEEVHKKMLDLASAIESFGVQIEQAITTTDDKFMLDALASEAQAVQLIYEITVLLEELCP